jgi:hypothetical protein
LPGNQNQGIAGGGFILQQFGRQLRLVFQMDKVWLAKVFI